MGKKKDYLEPCLVQVSSLQLEEDLLGTSITPALSPVEILGHESFGEYDYSSGSFVDAWYD